MKMQQVFNLIPSFHNVYIKKLLDSDCLRAVQFKCNSRKVWYQCNLHIEILDYDWLINNRVWSEPIISFIWNQACALDGAICGAIFPWSPDARAFFLLNHLEFFSCILLQRDAPYRGHLTKFFKTYTPIRVSEYDWQSPILAKFAWL